MPGLRERKKRATRAAIHDAGMRLFVEQGFTRTTIDQIAEAADVSRATVFSYFPTKEAIVFGDAPQAVEALAGALREAAAAEGALPAIRAWLRELTGWIEPDLMVQLRLVREVPAVGARRLQMDRDVERVIAEALEEELGHAQHLAAQLAAAALVGGLRVAEEAAVSRMEAAGRALTGHEIEELLDDAMAFAEAGVSALATRSQR